MVFESLHGKLLADHMFGNDVQLQDAEKRLRDSESKLARFRGQTNVVSSRSCGDDRAIAVKMERRSKSPIDRNEGSSKNQHQSRPELHIPNAAPKDSQPIPLSKSSAKSSMSSGAEASRGKSDKSHRLASGQQNIEIQDKGTKRKFGKTLISRVAFIIAFM